MANIYLVICGLYAICMNDPSPSRLLDQIVIRVPDGMRERIKRVADANGRSVNAELVALLDKTYPTEAIIDMRVREIEDLVKSVPAADRDDVWRSIFETLEEAKRRAET